MVITGFFRFLTKDKHITHIVSGTYDPLRDLFRPKTVEETVKRRMVASLTVKHPYSSYTASCNCTQEAVMEFVNLRFVIFSLPPGVEWAAPLPVSEPQVVSLFFRSKTA